MSAHDVIDQRSLVFGRAIADRLRVHPEYIAAARARLDRWYETASPGVRITLDEWRRELDGSLESVLRLLTSTDDRAIRLRQSNPFPGVLTEVERTAILRQFDRHDTAAA